MAGGSIGPYEAVPSRTNRPRRCGQDGDSEKVDPAATNGLGAGHMLYINHAYALQGNLSLSLSRFL